MNTRKIALLAAGFLLAQAGVAAAQDAVVSASNLNLRAGPGGQHRVVAMMPEGSRVKATNCGPEWCQVQFGQAKGYAAVAYLDFSSGADAQASVAQAPASAASATAAPAQIAARGTGYVVWSDPSPEQAARVWRWQEQDWRNRHARRVQWLQRHRTN